ncbi:hypothetical protein IHE44_0015040 [Lamprotornis superbus]|uniref:Cyanocobalamin reductase / alkylcobalamin dealkylase n=1 Tax=Lamprotornis superbus TaxID=245042 RepID=A0A835NT81_9PASS|nr:hypothetical protein IHE44_0015040 [Lamprotornis superbus]
MSTPSMFDKALKPFVKKERLKIIRDPVDQCVSHHLSRVKEKFPDQRVDVMFDYEMLPSRKPKFLAQTAAHVAGAAYYYQRKDVKRDPWGKKKIFGVCIHPKYGGWFAIRGLLLFPDIQVPFLEQPAPVDCVSTEEKRIELLEQFNFHWQDGRYRDIIEVKESREIPAAGALTGSAENHISLRNRLCGGQRAAKGDLGCITRQKNYVLSSEHPL